MDDWWLSLQMLLDSALPIGAFAHSYGLECLVQDGCVMDGTGLRAYIEGMIRHCWATSDLMVVKAIYDGDTGRRGGSPEALEAALPYACRVEELVHLQRLAPETRDGIEKTGRRLLKLAPELFPELDAKLLTEAIRTFASLGTFPFVYAALCRLLGVPLIRAAEGYLYASVVTCVNAGLRLLPMGQSEGQRIIASLLPVVREAWNAVADNDPLAVYGAMPLSELAMIRHETLYSRLFMS